MPNDFVVAVAAGTVDEVSDIAAVLAVGPLLAAIDEDATGIFWG